MSDLRGRAGRPKTRLAAAVAVLLTLATGLGVRAAASGGAAKYAGDALYTVLLCALLVLAAPRLRPATAAGLALLASWVVELSQLSGIPADLSRHSTAARLVLGSTFNPPDLFWYATGAAAAFLVHAAVVRHRRD